MITITAGHSNKDSGAVNGKWQENTFVTNTRNYVVHYLRKAMTTLEETHWLVAQAIADVIINYVKGKKL